MNDQDADRALWRYALLLCALLAVLGLDHGLWTPDEPREAEISREMALTPTMIPTLSGQRFIEKPPLYYWVVAGVFRSLGHPLANAARAVSALAGLLTALCVYLWAARAGQRRAGLIAALMLATSAQFVLSTHWVLIDPLLMLLTTLAAWAGWELLGGSAPRRWTALLYGALAAALWTKGLVGPVLMGAGLAAVAVLGRVEWRRLHPFGGIAFLALMVAMLGGAIWLEGGRDALWEWAWVNHVQRLLNPAQTSGHRQPLLYYSWTLPLAVLPWLLPLLDGLRPAAWRAAAPAAGLQRYGALLAAAMLLVLSIAATKRETYLLPLLPPLFLWLGLRVAGWWDGWRAQAGTRLGWRWWTQLGLLALYALAPAAAALAYLRRPDTLALALLGGALATVGFTLSAALRAQRERAGRGALACAWVGAAAWLLLLPHVLDTTKNMAPFVRWVDRQLPAGAPVYALNVDETLQAIVPFETGRPVIALDARAATPSGAAPEWVLVQETDRAARPPAGGYVLTGRATFGKGRALALWRRGSAPG